MVFCKSILFLLATSKDSSSSVIWTCSFFFTRCTSVFNFVSASTTRAFSCSISILVCLLIYFISCEHTITPYNRFIGFQSQTIVSRWQQQEFWIVKVPCLSVIAITFARWIAAIRWTPKVNAFRNIWHFTSNIFSNATSIRLPGCFETRRLGILCAFVYFDAALVWMFRCNS